MLLTEGSRISWRTGEMKSDFAGDYCYSVRIYLAKEFEDCSKFRLDASPIPRNRLRKLGDFFH